MNLSKTTLKFILLAITLLASALIALVKSIAQDQSYHQFTDQRTLFAIPNFWNVISNLPFLLVGLTGINRLYKKQLKINGKVQYSYFSFFIAVALVSFGSAYYHIQPNNFTLIWDRLPITLATMSLMSIALGEYLSAACGRNFLFPLLLIGLISVCYWYSGELHGCGDLRLYALVQFLPMLLLLVLLVFGQSIYQTQFGYWCLLAAYLLAKLAEHFDKEIFRFTSGTVSGHVIKHLLAATGIYMLMLYFEKRKGKILPLIISN